MALLKRGKKTEVVPPDLQNAEVRLQQNDLVNTSPPANPPAVVPVVVPANPPANPPVRRKKSPALLGLGALGLTGLALGAWYLLGSRQEPPEETALTPPPRRAAVPVASPVASAKAGSALKPGNPKATAKPGAATRPGAMAGDPRRPGGVAQREQLERLRQAAAQRPGRVGIAPPGSEPPQFAPSTVGQPPRMAPVQGAPTPIQPPYYAEGIPGRRGGRNEIVLAPRALEPASPTQLKELWLQGAAAKARGDIPAARRAWSQILRLSPGHPGIQQAINKLG